MNGDTFWSVDILLPYYTGETRWRVTHYGESEPLARRMLAAERRAGNRARLRCWTPAVVEADEEYDLAVPVCPPADRLDNTIPF